MHEYSVMSQIVESVLSEANKRKAKGVEEVELQIGEFTMLGEEQLKFAYEVLSKDTLLEGSKLTVGHITGKIECACGYEGKIAPDPDSPHKVVPILECPKCHGAAKIIEGRECVIRNIRMVVPDV